MMRHLLPLLILIFAAACVPNRKVTMLQKNDINKKGLPKDTTVRTYALDTFNYRIQPNDVLLVRFQSLTPEVDPFRNTAPGTNQINPNNAGLSGDLVDESGYIVFPVVGKVKVAGLTVFEAQDTLQYIASQYIESPTVKVRLVNFRMTILGEVSNQGVITFSNNRVNILEAIGEAGGFTELADRENVKLIRQRGNETDVQYINLLDERFVTSPYFYVNQNDVLVVPPLRQRPFRLYYQSNLTLFFSTLSAVLFAITLLK